MLKSILLYNFTVFREATVKFSPNLNVIIGENGAGKSHILKLAYSLHKFFEFKENGSLPKEHQEKLIALKLTNVFQPEDLGRLVARKQGRNRCEIRLTLDSSSNINLNFATNSKSNVNIDKLTFHNQRQSLFIPPKELLSIYPGFASLYRDRVISFDETYADLCNDLDRPLLKGPRAKDISILLAPIANTLGGTITQSKGSFYYSSPGKGSLEIPLLAEGLRKVGMIAYLLTNGSLVKNGTLFWDEPESNLNPKLIRDVAHILVEMAEFGIQIVLATHSLYLMRELDILTKQRKTQALFTTLLLNEDASVEAVQADDMEKLPRIVALEEEVDQSERYLAMETEND